MVSSGRFPRSRGSSGLKRARGAADTHGVDAAERKEILSRYMDHSRRFEAVAARRAGNGHQAEVIPFTAPLQELERMSEINPEAFNNTNRMRLYVFANDDRAQAVLLAVYDNLGKGASGAAVQNLNLMLGIAADTSLAA